MVVLFRVTIGWHFASEGMDHILDPSFSAAGLFGAAKGPLAPFYHDLLPDVHGWREIMDAPEEPKPETSSAPSASGLESTGAKADSSETASTAAASPDVGESTNAAPEKTQPRWEVWKTRVAADWGQELDRFSGHYGFSEDQQASARESLKEAVEALQDYNPEASTTASKFEEYLHTRRRLAKEEQDALMNGVPFSKERFAAQRSNLTSTAKEITGWAKKKHADLLAEWDLLVSPSQRAQVSSYRPQKTQLEVIDSITKYFLFGVGCCLMGGVFTRWALLGGALFLLSVNATQPPWVFGAKVNPYTIVEMMGMLALATMPTGRWGGLDAILHGIFGSKEKPQ